MRVERLPVEECQERRSASREEERVEKERVEKKCE